MMSNIADYVFHEMSVPNDLTSVFSAIKLMVKNLQFEDGKMISAAQYFRAGSSAAVELTEEEKTFAQHIRVRPVNSTFVSGCERRVCLTVFPHRLCGRVF